MKKSGEATLTLNGRGDLMMPIPPAILALLGFPHSFRWDVMPNGTFVATPSHSKWSQRQIKKFKARHNLP